MLIPLLTHSVQAGFPSPAESDIESHLSLDDYLIEHKAATLFVRVKGLSMVEAGIIENDILIVDRSLNPRQGDFVIACLNNEYTLKLFHLEKNKIWLLPANPHFSRIELKPHSDNFIMGVVSGVVRKIR
ncbi:MAG: translesion error-prone DNA polymerase V autoproteolytic subunit [Legionellales bacterium]|nr:translesion error-prone DNA polymerase V autoproteolytic subunit [Legionellales bacterium]